MANTINDLYLKYVNKVGSTLEKDRYFQYLFEMVQAGSNVLQQKNQVMHKVVDERWLTTIEESLDAINNIIEKPRRFITTNEEVVPVALARKITADSVRHLSMNTQFIASNENNEIQPTRILNVSTEESYDLYENRFIYHLIQRLVTFIDKRTDIIFWSTGDETRNTLVYQSKVDDAYEEIEYKLEMTVKNRQSFAENDSDNMQVFMRIDRVRRLVMALRNSPFCSLMAGCSKVRSPIQRTNLMMKDPNYRTCYKLWQFLERYDEVGYTIEVRDSALEFDEEYLIQLYTNLITNYTVFKSLLEDTPRDLQDASAKKRKPIKPKFIKKIEEEIVDDYNIEDVEVRQVIIEEVTQAQLDAEASLAEEREARKTAEEALEDLESQMRSLQQQLFSAMEMSTAANEQAEAERKEKEEAQQEAERERREKEAALQKAEEALRDMQAAKAEAEAQMLASQEAKAQAASEIEQTKQQALFDVKAEQQRAETKIAEIRSQAASEVEAAQNKAAAEITATKEQAASEVEAAQTQLHEEQETRTRAEYRAEEMAKARQDAEALRDAALKAQSTAEDDARNTREQAECEIRTAKEEAASEIRAAKEEAEREIRAAKEQAASEIQAAKAAASAQIETISKEAESQLKAARSEAESQRKRADKESRARARAQEKADANSLSKYILAAFGGGRKPRPAETPDQVTAETPDERSDKVTAEVSDQVSDKVMVEVPDDVSDKVLAETSDQVSDKVS
jgi:hypothetical protein